MEEVESTESSHQLGATVDASTRVCLLFVRVGVLQETEKRAVQDEGKPC